MKLIRKKSCLIIYALFFAIFKPYFLPTNMQQGIKILIIMWCLFLIAIKMKPIRWINISLLYSGIIAISSYIAYKNNYVSQSTLLDGIFYSICIYVVYTIFEYLCKKENIEYIMACILDVSGLYAVLTILSLFKPLYIDDSGLSVYLFGNKFLSSYYLLFFLMTFYSVYNIKIKNNYTWRIRFLFLALICLLFTVGAKCSTGAIATILIIISLFVPDKIKRVLKSPWIVMGSMVASALFPTFMTVIMNNSIVRYIVVQVFHESVDLNFRNVIYNNHIFQLISKSFWYGYGYNNTMMLDKTNQVFSNAQNALLEIILRFGSIGAIILVITVLYCFCKGAKSDCIEGYVWLTYIYIIIGTVEVSYSWCFILSIFLVRWGSKTRNNSVIEYD